MSNLTGLRLLPQKVRITTMKIKIYLISCNYPWRLCTVTILTVQMR